MRHQIEVKNTSFSYSDKQVFSNLSLNVGEREIFCIVGPNGCGKTTLLDCILGLLRPDSGEIVVDGLRLQGIEAKKLAERLAYVPQVHHRTFPYLVKDIVLMGRAYRTSPFTAPSKEDRAIAMAAMSWVGIQALADTPYTQISGGQCQMVMIARALAQQPKVIVMDEPTSHLDFKNELLLLEIIEELVKNNGISILMATHFPNHAYHFEAKGLRTNLALMNNGAFERIGKPREILNEENVRSIYGINSRVLDCSLDNNTALRQIVPLSIVKDK